MSQLQISKQRRTAIARRRGEVEPLPLDPRDPDITRAKQLQRRLRRPSARGLGTSTHSSGQGKSQNSG